jgi:hypothetical protein
MKWTYKECDVIITAVWNSPSLKLTPFVEINCKYTTGRHIVLTTAKSFTTVAMAEHGGQNMAREWIYENPRA